MEEQEADELQAALGDLGQTERESVSSLSELRIFLFREAKLSLFTSEAVGLASWLDAERFGEAKPVGNMKKRNNNKKKERADALGGGGVVQDGALVLLSSGTAVISGF